MKRYLILLNGSQFPSNISHVMWNRGSFEISFFLKLLETNEILQLKMTFNVLLGVPENLYFYVHILITLISSHHQVDFISQIIKLCKNKVPFYHNSLKSPCLPLPSPTQLSV